MSDVFDKEALMEQIDGDFEFLEETAAMLEEDGPALLEEIGSAAAARNAEALVGPSHALKSMVANFRAAAAETAARELEVMGRENRLDGVDAAVETARCEMNRLRAALRRFLEANAQ